MVFVNTFTICLSLSVLNFIFAVLHLEDNAILVMGFYLPKYESKVPFDLNTQIENGRIFCGALMAKYPSSWAHWEHEHLDYEN